MYQFVNYDVITHSKKRFTGSRSNDVSKLIELLSELEHKQWMYYSKNVHSQLKKAHTLEYLITSTQRKWAPNWISYSSLSDKEKKKDREWAMKVLKILRNNKRLTKALLMA